MGGLSKGKLASARSRRNRPLGAISLYDGPDDGDEPVLTRHSGYVPDVLATLLGVLAHAPVCDYGDLYDWGACRRHKRRLALRPARAPRLSCLGSRACHRRGAALGLCAFTSLTRHRRFSPAVFRARSLG